VRAAFKLPGIRRKVAARGLSKLSVWRLRLGIAIERIKPGHPEQNGRHERMHLTLNKEATKPAAANVLQQQARFDAFLDRYNRDRPHQALCMKVPGLLHTLAACIPRPGGAHLPAFRCYGDGDQLRAHLLEGWENQSQPRACGTECRVAQVGERIWLVTFMHYDLGYFDDETCRLEPIENPFGPNVLLMSSE